MTGKEEKDDTETMNGIRNEQLNGGVPNNQADARGLTIQNDRVVQGVHVPQQALHPASQHAVLPPPHHSMHSVPQYQVVSSAQQPGTFFTGVNPNNAVYVSNPHMSNAMVDQNGNILYNYSASQYMGQPNTDRNVQNNMNPNAAFSPSYIQQQPKQYPREMAPLQSVPPTEGFIQVPFENGSQSTETHDNILLARKVGPISDRKMTSSNRSTSVNTQIPTNSSNTINSQSQPNPKSYQPNKAVLTEEGEVVRVKKSRPTSDRRRRSSFAGDLRATDKKNHRPSLIRHRSRRSSIAMGDDPNVSKSSRTIRPQVEVEERFHASDSFNDLGDLVEVDEILDLSNRPSLPFKESNNNHSSRNVRNPPTNTDQYRRSNSGRNNRRSSNATDENVSKLDHHGSPSLNRARMTDNKPVARRSSIAIGEGKDPTHQSEPASDRIRPLNEHFEKPEDGELRRLTKAAERGIRKSNSEKRVSAQRRSSIAIGEKIKPSHHSDPTINRSRFLDKNSDRSNKDNVRKGTDKRDPQRSNSERNLSRQKAESTSIDSKLRRNHHSDPTIDRTLEQSQTNESGERGLQKSSSLRSRRRRHSIGSQAELPSPLKPNIMLNFDPNDQNSTKDDMYLKEPTTHQQLPKNDCNRGFQTQKKNDGRSQPESRIGSMGSNDENKSNQKLTYVDKSGTQMDSFTSTTCPFVAVEFADTQTEKIEATNHDTAHIERDRTVPISNSLTSTVSPLAEQDFLTDQSRNMIGKTIEHENLTERERNETVSNSLTSKVSPLAARELSNDTQIEINGDNNKTNTQIESATDDNISNSMTSTVSPLLEGNLNIREKNHEQNDSNSGDNDFLSDCTPTIKNPRNENTTRELDDKLPNHRENILHMNKQVGNTSNQNNTPPVTSQSTPQTSDISNHQHSVDSHNNQDHSFQPQRAVPPANGNLSHSQQPVNYSMEIQKSQQNIVTNTNSNIPQPTSNYPDVDQSINNNPNNQQQSNSIPIMQQQIQNSSAPHQFANNYATNQQQIHESPAINHATNISSNHQPPHYQYVNSQYNNNISRDGYSQIQPDENNLNTGSVSMHESVMNTHTNNELNLRQTRLQNDNMQYTAVPTDESRGNFTGRETRGPETFPTIQEHQPSNDAENNGECIEAFIANDVVDATGVTLCLGDEEEKIVEERKYLTRGFLIAICIVFVVIATVVPVSLFILKKDPEVQVTFIEIGNPPTNYPTLSPSSKPSYFPTSVKFSEMSQEMIRAKITNNTALMTPGSPQYRALEWFSQDSIKEGRNKSDQRYLQRFVLAIFHYALSEESIHGEGWHKCSEGKQCVSGESSWLSDTDECEWAMISCDLGRNVIGIHGSECTNFYVHDTFIFKE